MLCPVSGSNVAERGFGDEQRHKRGTSHSSDMGPTVLHESPAQVPSPTPAPSRQPIRSICHGPRAAKGCAQERPREPHAALHNRTATWLTTRGLLIPPPYETEVLTARLALLLLDALPSPM
jgi:hypothetical protein